MRPLSSDPWLWLIASLLISLPVWGLITVIGLASGDPLLWSDIDLIVVAVVGLVPTVWVQWNQPVYLFTVITSHLDPAQLSPLRRQALAALLTLDQRITTGLLTAALLILLRQMYQWAPLFESLTPIHFTGGSRLTGLALASGGFLLMAATTHLGSTALRLMTLTPPDLQALPPLDLQTVPDRFTLIGQPGADPFHSSSSSAGTDPNPLTPQS